ncbi:MAG: 30S ribosomal protein S16 [Gemmatimonadaceae bacterium]|nr:30S ribosomal protein S16 [Gemmatimonadaceae bacterium]
MVKLRLKRMGRRKRPFYRIVATTDNLPRSGHSLQELGTYDPVHARFEVDEEAAVDWLKKGAQMTPTVHDLLRSKGILARWRGFEGVDREGALTTDKPKRRKKLGAAAPAEAEEAPEAAPVEEAPEAASSEGGEPAEE